MEKLYSTIASTALLFALVGCSPSDTKTKAAQVDILLPEVVHQHVITLDTHVDIPLNYMSDEMDPGSMTTGQVDLVKMKDGGLDAAFFIIFTAQTEVNAEGYVAAREMAETRYQAIKRLTETYPERIELAKTGADVRRIHKSGKQVALIGMENAFPIGENIADVAMWAERGVRYMGITHMGHNQFGDSSNPKEAKGETAHDNGGLTPLGRELIAAMNASGIMVDVSHAGKQTMLQAIEVSKTPIIASHSGVMHMAESLRNLDDEQLRAIAKNNGVAQMVAFYSYVKEKTPEQLAFVANVRKEMGVVEDSAFWAMDDETRKKYRDAIKPAKALGAPANVQDFIDHIDYAVKIAGINHVGISSDFDGGGGVDGWKDASETLNVTKELVKRGYSQDEIEKIWGGNLLRVMADVDAYANKH